MGVINDNNGEQRFRKMETVDLILSDHDFNRIRQIVHQVTGIHLVDSKRALIVSRLYKRLRNLSFSTFKPYIARLETDPEEMFFLINRITTNITKFYRENNQFQLLRERILPGLMEEKRKKKQPTLRVWSAGCSTGEEVYTVLFEVVNYFKGNIPASLDVKILGSDIDTNVLTKARSGEYSVEEVKDVSQRVLGKFFSKTPDSQYIIKDQWKSYVGFRRINLVYDPFEFKHKIDIIFCRNVVIYFDRETKNIVYEKFHNVLNDPGYFFSGHSENLFKYNSLFTFIGKSIYQKVVQQ